MKHSDRLKAAVFIRNHRPEVVRRFMLWRESACIYVGMAVGLKVTVSNLRTLLKMKESHPEHRPSNRGSSPECPGLTGQRWNQRIKPRAYVLNH